MKKLITKAEFVKILDLLNYEGSFDASPLLLTKLGAFDKDFVYALTFEIDGNAYLIRKSEHKNDIQFEVYSIK